MEYNQDMKNRLKRIEGQVRGVLRMMEEGKDCREVITQLTASRSALDRTIGLVVGTNLEQCLREQFESGNGSNEELIKEAVQLLVKADNLSNVSVDRFSKRFNIPYRYMYMNFGGIDYEYKSGYEFRL